MRDTPGLPFFEEALIEDSPFPRGPGYYALSRHEDIWQVSRNAHLFCSSKGSNIGDLPQEMNEFFGSMINMDDPKHFRLRSIVSKGFTPKEVGRVEENVRVKAAEIVDRLLEQFPDKQCDFVEHVAAALPLEIICDMMGIPAGGLLEDLQVDQHDPRRRRPRVRRHARGPDGTSARDVHVRPGARRGSPRQPDRRHHLGDDGRRPRRRPAHGPGVRLVLHPARRRRERDHPQRRQPRHEGAHRSSRPTRASCSATTRALRRRRWRRSCGGRRRSSTSAARPPRTPRSPASGPEGGRQGRDVLQLGQPRRAGVRGPVHVRRAPPDRSPPRSASAPAARTSASAPTSPGAR